MKTILATTISSALFLTACSEPVDTNANNTSKTTTAVEVSSQQQDINPLMKPSSLQYQAPDFAAIEDAHFLPAFTKGMKQQKQEIAFIVENTTPTSFINTIVALERSGELLGRTSSIFFNLSGTDSNPTRRELQKGLAPKLLRIAMISS